MFFARICVDPFVLMVKVSFYSDAISLIAPYSKIDFVIAQRDPALLVNSIMQGQRAEAD